MSPRAAAVSTTRATSALTGPGAPSPLTALTSFTSARRASIRLAAQIVTTASRCVAWLAGSSAGCWLPCYPLRQSHQQLPSSHATDREAVIAAAVDVAASDNIARGEVRGISVARTIRNRRPIVSVRSRIVQRATAEVAAAQKVVGGVRQKRAVSRLLEERPAPQSLG